MHKVRAITHVIVGTTLASGEYSLVNALLEVLRILQILPEEDQARSRATEGLMRCSSNNVTELEGVVKLLCSNETARMRHITHEECTLGVGDVTKPLVVPVARVSGSTTNDETGLEELCLLGEVFIVDKMSFGVDTVGEGLEVNGGGGHLLAGGL